MAFRVNIYFIIFVSSFAMIANGVLVIVFVVDPLRCLRNVSSALIINLAVADFLTGAMILIWATEIWQWQPLVMSQVVFSTIWLGYTASFLTIAVLSCERYIAIRYIWSAGRIVTKKRTLFVIFGIWVLSSFSFIAMPTKNIGLYVFSLSSVLEVCIFVVVVFYLKLWRLRRKQSQRESTMAVKQEMKLTIVVLLLVLLLIITALPLMIVYQLLFLKDTSSALPLRLLPLFALNFGLNPIIYGWRLPKYRRSFHRLFSMLFQNISFKRNNNVRIFNRGHHRHSTAIISQFTSASCTSF